MSSVVAAATIAACSSDIANPIPIAETRVEDSSAEPRADRGGDPVPDTDAKQASQPDPEPGWSFDDAIQISPVLDEATTATTTIDRKGGEISATGPDGTEYTLTVPADALAFGAEITMTPLASVEDLPFGDGAVYGVDLQPSGLAFLDAATLTITPPEPIDPGEQVPFSYSGTELGLASLTVDPDRIEVVVNHFSGYGVQRGFYGHTGEVLDRIGSAAHARIEAGIQQILGEQRLHALKGQDPDPASWDQLRELFRQYEEQVVNPRLAAALESCDSGLTVLRFLMGYLRQIEILGGSETASFQTYSDGLVTLLNAVALQCLDEEYRMCVEEHIVHRMLYVWLALARDLDLIGGEASQHVIDKAAELTESCMTFELEFTNTAEANMDDGSGLIWSVDTGTVTFPVKFRTTGYPPKFQETTAPFVADSAEIDYSGWKHAGKCSATPVPWTGEAHFVDMRWNVTEVNLSNAIGEVDDLLVRVEMPTGQFRAVAQGTCEGHDWQLGFPAEYLYEMLHQGEESLEGWTILGGETFATLEWDGTMEIPGAVIAETGTAVLRHIPGA